MGVIVVFLSDKEVFSYIIMVRKSVFFIVILQYFACLLWGQGADVRWDQKKLPKKSKGIPVISLRHAGTAGIIASNAAELNLVNQSRIGFSENTELLFRVAEEFVMPNMGLKHRWWRNHTMAFATEHTLYYPYPGLKMLQSAGIKDWVPDTVDVHQGVAMRNELLFSWLINPQEPACTNPVPQMVLTGRAGLEFYAGAGDNQVAPVDYFQLLYHTQILTGKILYYGGLQLDSYFLSRFHYSVNALLYSVDMKQDYAIEGNLRLTCYVSNRVGISVMAKMAYADVTGITRQMVLPMLDLTYLIRPGGHGTIEHGLFKSRKK